MSLAVIVYSIIVASQKLFVNTFQIDVYAMHNVYVFCLPMCENSRIESGRKILFRSVGEVLGHIDKEKKTPK